LATVGDRLCKIASMFLPYFAYLLLEVWQLLKVRFTLTVDNLMFFVFPCACNIYSSK